MAKLNNDVDAADFNWVDLAGLLAQKSDVNAFMQAVSENKINDVSSLNQELRKLYNKYEKEFCIQIFNPDLNAIRASPIHFKSSFLKSSRLRDSSSIKIILSKTWSYFI